MMSTALAIDQCWLQCICHAASGNGDRLPWLARGFRWKHAASVIAIQAHAILLDAWPRERAASLVQRTANFACESTFAVVLLTRTSIAHHVPPLL